MTRIFVSFRDDPGFFGEETVRQELQQCLSELDSRGVSYTLEQEEDAFTTLWYVETSEASLVSACVIQEKE